MSRALLTMVYNERIFLPIWLRYYSRFFAPEDIYVIDHATTDGSTDAGGFVRIPVEHPSDDDYWRVEVVEREQRELLDRYDVVLATDVDEIVAPDPRVATLGDYIDEFDREFVNCVGYELLHMKRSEPPFDPSLRVLEQRSHWFRNPGYDKPLLAKVPISWGPGFHIRVDGRIERDPGLRMIHLHRMRLRDLLRAPPLAPSERLESERRGGRDAATRTESRRIGSSSTGSTTTAALRTWESTSRRSRSRPSGSS